jgi:hypothetical protein
MLKSDYLKAIPIYNDIDQLERQLARLRAIKGDTLTVLSVVFDMGQPFQLRGLDDKFCARLKKLMEDELVAMRNERITEFKSL